MTATGPAGAPLANLSIIVPTLNAGLILDQCLERLGEATGAEIVVVDGGSVDDTLTVAGRSRAVVLTGHRGRGHQLGLGAVSASRQWLLFLHADTLLQPGWTVAVARWIESPGANGGYAVFRFRLDDSRWWARLLEGLVHARVHAFRLPYGDQGLLLCRDLYDRSGGYARIPLMEDVDLVRRLDGARLTVLTANAETSADRWRSDGWLRRSVRNLICLAGYHLGIPPERIARFYGR